MLGADSALRGCRAGEAKGGHNGGKWCEMAHESYCLLAVPGKRVVSDVSGRGAVLVNMTGLNRAQIPQLGRP